MNNTFNQAKLESMGTQAAIKACTIHNNHIKTLLAEYDYRKSVPIDKHDRPKTGHENKSILQITRQIDLVQDLLGHCVIAVR